MVKKKEEIIDEKQDEVKVVETNKKKTPVGLIITIAVIASITIIASAVLPFIFMFGFLSFVDDDVEFEVIDQDTISIPSENTVVEKVNDYYDKEDECYVARFKVDREGERDKKSSFFDVGTTLEITYTFKDADDYIIGEETLLIEDLDKYNKVKKEVYYCGYNANEVKGVEVKEVLLY